MSADVCVAEQILFTFEGYIRKQRKFDYSFDNWLFLTFRSERKTKRKSEIAKARVNTNCSYLGAKILVASNFDRFNSDAIMPH